VEQSRVLDTAEQPSVLVNDVMIAADLMEATSLQNRKMASLLRKKRLQNRFRYRVPETLVHLSVLEKETMIANEAMVDADSSEGSKTPNREPT
jgi:hypothetical protein